MDSVEWGFTNAEQQRVAFFEADVSRAMDQVRGEAIGDGGEGAHGARQNNHCVSGIASAGNVGTDIALCVLLDFGGRCAEELLCEVVAAADMQFFGEDAESAVGGNEVYFCYAGVGCEGAKHLNNIDRSAGSGYCERDGVWVAHWDNYL